MKNASHGGPEMNPATTASHPGLKFQVQSSSDASKVYTVTLDSVRTDGRATTWCTCPAWKYCRGPVQQKSCKHIRAARAGQLVALPVVTAPVVLPAAA